jgi:hypothetical protein
MNETMIGMKKSMKHLIIFKTFLVAFCIPVIALPVIAQTGVPVHDTLTNQTIVSMNTNLLRQTNTIADSGNQVTAAINNLAKQNANLIGEQSKAIQESQQLVYGLEQKRRNADLYDPRLGAKVNGGCSNYYRAKTLISGQISKKQIYKRSVDLALENNERERYSSPNENVMAANSNRIINQLSLMRKMRAKENKSQTNKDGVLVETWGESLSNTPDPETKISPYAAAVIQNTILSNPFPDRIPANYDEPNQPAAKSIQNARAMVKIERFMVADKIRMHLLSNQNPVFDKNWGRYMYSVGENGDEIKKANFGTAEKQGWAAALAASNRARAFDPDWVRYTSNSANEAALLRDNNLMMANVLLSLQELVDQESMQTKLTADMYTLLVEQYGKDDPLAAQ